MANRFFPKNGVLVKVIDGKEYIGMANLAIIQLYCFEQAS
ncbi:hypothetical protein [Faecalibacillus intestinalis]